ncbi:hypothetical protein LC605_24135, partial [Nostoc sp. CHAB 5836]|uniref:glycine-rich domain-containing protein n=1 Tax=Nostoc sp. CHAB 5836 TaxID=2780404 RepID=UPI0034D9550E|nr:hypothetical protein [Nostoc sp. CHAB 5836]
MGSLVGTVGSSSGYIAFTVSGNWVKPSGIQWIYVVIYGGGGGGQGGANDLSGAGFGIGGSGGSCVVKMFSAAQITSPVPVTVGAGGSGSSGSSTSTAAANGGMGGTSSFGDYAIAYGGANNTGASTLANSTGTITPSTPDAANA